MTQHEKEYLLEMIKRYGDLCAEANYAYYFDIRKEWERKSQKAKTIFCSISDTLDSFVSEEKPEYEKELDRQESLICKFVNKKLCPYDQFEVAGGQYLPKLGKWAIIIYFKYHEDSKTFCLNSDESDIQEVTQEDLKNASS